MLFWFKVYIASDVGPAYRMFASYTQNQAEYMARRQGFIVLSKY